MNSLVPEDPSVNNLIILNYLRYAYQVTPTILDMIMVTTKQKFDLHESVYPINQKKAQKFTLLRLGTQ